MSMGWKKDPEGRSVERVPANRMRKAFQQCNELFRKAPGSRKSAMDPIPVGLPASVNKLCDWVGVTVTQYHNITSRDRETRPYTVFLFALGCHRFVHYQSSGSPSVLLDEHGLVGSIPIIKERTVRSEKAQVLENVFIQELHRQLPTRQDAIKLAVEILERTPDIKRLEERLIYMLGLFSDPHWPELVKTIPRIVPKPHEGVAADIGVSLKLREEEEQRRAKEKLEDEEQRRNAWLAGRSEHRLWKSKIREEKRGTPEG